MRAGTAARVRETARTSVGLLSAAGLLSAVLTEATVLHTQSFLYTAGIVFGTLVAAYFALYEGQRSLIRSGLFLAACAAAFPAAVHGALLAVTPFISTLQPFSRVRAPLLIFAIAGGSGAGLVLLAALFLYGPKGLNSRAFIPVLAGSLGGALLGIIGFALIQAPGPNVLARNALARNALARNALARNAILIWQPGTALLMALMLKWERRCAQGTTCEAPRSFHS